MSEQIYNAIAWGTARCTDCSDTAKLDAELLLAHCIEKPRSYLYSWPEQFLTDEVWQRYQSLVEKRIMPTPVAYLLGKREFFSLEFIVTDAALIPRPETELLVETCLEICSDWNGAGILELGTGTGVIAIALKVNRPDFDLVATDISSDCLDLARKNATVHGAQIDWLESDWYAAVNQTRSFDMVLSNPPYVAASDPYLTQGDLPAEPVIALTPGTSGLEALEQIITQAPDYLAPQGYLLLEHGFDQQADVASMMHDRGFVDISCLTDLNQLPRLSIGRMSR